jgi:N-methylhydantoinase B
MYEYGERMMRSYVEKIPDGHYAAQGSLDNSGVGEDLICFEWRIDVNGTEVNADYTTVCPQVDGPMNCPHPTTISATYLVFAALSRSMGYLNEGYFRPITITTRPGTLYHPVPPAPCYLFGWATNPLYEGTMRAIGAANPELVTGRSGACVLTLIWWGRRAKSGKVWVAGSPLPIGNGAGVQSDGMTGINIGMAFGQIPPMELWEAKFPWLIERYEQAPDSQGAGEHAGGAGINIDWRVLEDCALTSTIEQTKSVPWGLLGGTGGRRNAAEIVYPDGLVETFSKITNKPIPAGSLVRVRSGGGGGYGEPRLRPVERVNRDLRDGYITTDFAKQHYPQAF